MITFDYDKSYRKGRLICDETLFNFIRNHFSVKNVNSTFVNKQLKMKGSNVKIPDREYAVQQSGLFDIGLYNEIRKFLISESITEIIYTDAFKDNLKCGFVDYSVSDTLKYPLRDYQKDTIQKCLRFGRGTVVVATGGGKSLIQASILENWKRLKGSLKALIVVPGTALVSQLLKDFEDYGVTFTYSGWTGNMEKQDTEVIIVNTELFCSQFGNFKDLIHVDLVMRDECHGNKAQNVATKLISKIRTPNKFGFTGTLPKEKMDEWKIIGTFGPIIYEKNSKELRDEGFLTNATIKMIKLNHPKKVRGYKSELQFIHSDEKRNRVIKKLVFKMNKNVLILVNRLDHGDLIAEQLNIPGKETFFVHGAMPVEERIKIIDKMEKQDNVICVAMGAIFSTGINIKNLHYIVFAGGGKSFVRIVQSIGRGLRLHETKQLLVLFDLYDNFLFSTNHAEERKKFYDDQQIDWSETEVNL